MITDKEYPATHSMSTSWYVADEDGNVGIMDFNENGPVPWQTEENCIESLIYGHNEEDENNTFLPIALTDEQIDDLMENPHSPEDEELWFDRIIQIDLGKEKEFLKLAENPDFDIEHCVSKVRGLYDIDAFHCMSDSKVDGRCQVLEASSLKKMLDQGIILQVYDKKDFWMNDEWDDDEVVHEKHYTSAPYYLFHQPYWVEKLPVCMNVPRSPVKLEQLPEKLRERVLRIPVKFKETESFQIAEWYPCAATGMRERAEKVDGCEYELLPLTDGSMAYLCTDIVLPSDFFRYCSEKELYHCSSCESHCHTCNDHCFTAKPTILVVMHPLEKWDYLRQTKSDSLMLRSVWIPFLPKIPLKIPIGPGVTSSSPYESYVSYETISKHVNNGMLMKFFSDNRKYFEDMITCFNPRVIILCEDAVTFLEELYKITENQITIKDVDYPLYRQSEVEKHRIEIERLAMLPYQGTKIPHIISVEEMERIKQQQ